MKKYTFLISVLFFSHLAQAEPQYSAEFNQCMNKANGVTADVINCIGKELENQDKKLNANYKTLKAGLKEARQKQLIEVQRLWIQYRDANCQFYNDPDGGSMHRIFANECFLRMTAERAEELNSLRTFNN